MRERESVNLVERDRKSLSLRIDEDDLGERYQDGGRSPSLRINEDDLRERDREGEKSMSLRIDEDD